MNDQKINEAKGLMEVGWKAREALNFDEAEKLLISAKEIFESESDWYNVTECLNHLSYNEKLKAVQSLKKGVAFAEQSLRIAGEHETKKTGVLRALFSLNATMGNYEIALKFINEYLELQKKPEDAADAEAHKALFLLRTGKEGEALSLVDEAIQVLRTNVSGVGEPHISIWLSAALLKKAIMLLDMGSIEEAQVCRDEALNIALAKGLKTRLVEIEEFSKNLQK